MKAPIIVLLTSDAALEDVVADALFATDGIGHLARNARDALQIVCGTGRELDLAVIDCEHAPYATTLVGTIIKLREAFPVIAITAGPDEKYIEELAYANGATACLSKPVSAQQLADAMKQCRRLQHHLAIA